MKSLKPAVKREKAPHKAADAKAFEAKVAEHQKSVKYRDDLLSGASIEITGIDTTQPLYVKGSKAADVSPYFTLWLSTLPVATLATDVCGGTLKPSIPLKDTPLRFPLTNEALTQLRVGKLIVNVECHSLGRITDTLIGYTSGRIAFTDAKSNEVSTAELRVLDGSDSFVGCIRLGVKCIVDGYAAPQAGDQKLPDRPVLPAEKFKSVEAFKRSLNPRFTRQKALHKIKDKKVWEAKTKELQATALVREDQLSGASVSVVGIDCFGKLPAQDGDSSDPYFVFWLDEWPIGSLSTIAKSATLTPAWNLKKDPLTFPLTNQALHSLRQGRLALNVEVMDLDVSFDDFMCYTNAYLKYTDVKNGIIENDYQLFDDTGRPAGEVRLYLAVDVETKAPAGADELPSRIAPAVLDSKSGRLIVTAASPGRRASQSEVAATSSPKPVHDCNVIVYAAPPHRRVKATQVVKDQKVWTGAKREEHNKLAGNSHKDLLLHQPEALLSVIDIRTTSKIPGKAFIGGKTSDAYVVVHVPSFNVGSLKTPTVKKTVEPVWDLTGKPLSFPLSTKAVKDWNNGRIGDVNGLPVHFELWHLGVITDDLIGWTNVNIKVPDFNDKNLAAYDLPLLDEKTNKPLASGVIRVTIRMDQVPRMAPEVPEVDEVAAMIATSTAEEEKKAAAAAAAAVAVPSANGNGSGGDVKSAAPEVKAAPVMVATDLPAAAAPAPAVVGVVPVGVVPTPAPAPALAPAPAPVASSSETGAAAPAVTAAAAPADDAESKILAAMAADASSAPAPQKNWKWCKNCQGLWWTGAAGAGGVCANGYAAHSNGEHMYSVHREAVASGSQDGWRWCVKCLGLHFPASANSVCAGAAGGAHSSNGSATYHLQIGAGPHAAGGQPHWYWCSKCALFVYKGCAENVVVGKCAATGGEHAHGEHPYVAFM